MRAMAPLVAQASTSSSGDRATARQWPVTAPIANAPEPMPPTLVSLDTLAAWARGLAAGPGSEDGAGALAVVDLDDGAVGGPSELHAGIAAVVVGITSASAPEAHPAAGLCDVVLGRGDPLLSAITATVEAAPIASTALAVLLRGGGRRTIDDGLVAESAVYSSLQAGPEFAAWRAARPIRERPSRRDRVRMERAGPVLRIVLNRPEARNALDAAMRDALVEAFRLPLLDPSITEVHLSGDGPAFCTGGDLDEFGSFADPASAHLVRLQQSVGRAIAAVADRVVAHLHGACAGSGIELPAFARRVVADPSTRFSLPEVSLGLIPGAGGTVSLPRRVGRHRTALLALRGETIDAPTALEWGLIDGIEERRV